MRRCIEMTEIAAIIIGVIIGVIVAFPLAALIRAVGGKVSPS